MAFITIVSGSLWSCIWHEVDDGFFCSRSSDADMRVGVPTPSKKATLSNRQTGSIANNRSSTIGDIVDSAISSNKLLLYKTVISRALQFFAQSTVFHRFLLQTVYTYSIALLLDPVQYFAVKADSAWKFRLVAEPVLRKALFPFWNREYAVNDLYVFGTDISEDGVFFGFSILLLTWAFLYSLRRPELRYQLSILLAFTGVGWFLTYTTVSKWSLFNQRYFIAAFLLCLPLVGQLFQSVQSQPRSWKRNAAFGLFGFVMITALLFSYSYLFYNTHVMLEQLASLSLIGVRL